MKVSKILLFGALILAVSACGTTSKVVSTGQSGAAIEQEAATLATVLRRDLSSGVTKSELDGTFRSILVDELPGSFLSYVAEDVIPSTRQRVLIALLEWSPGDQYLIQVTFGATQDDKLAMGWPASDGTYAMRYSEPVEGRFSVLIARGQSTVKDVSLQAGMVDEIARRIALRVESEVEPRVKSTDPVAQRSVEVGSAAPAEKPPSE